MHERSFGLNINKLKHTSFLVLMLFVLIMALSGCSSQKMIEQQSEEVIKKGLPIIEEYVKSISEEAKITYCNMLNGGSEGSPAFGTGYPSHMVEAFFTVDDKRYTVVANIEDGSVISDYDMKDPNRIIKAQLEEYCDEYGFTGEFEVEGAMFSNVLISHQVEIRKGVFEDTYTYIDNLAPIFLDDEFKNASLSGFRIKYHSDEGAFFDPLILQNYLMDSGNYRKENVRGDHGEYLICGGMDESQYANNRAVYYEISMISEGRPEEMTCNILRRDCKEEEEYICVYVGGEKNCNIKSIDNEDYIEYLCPFETDNNEITYTGDKNPYAVSLYLKQPKKRITVVSYSLENTTKDDDGGDKVDRWELVPSEEEELETIKCQNSDYYELYSKNTKNKWEFLSDKEIILFEK